MSTDNTLDRMLQKVVQPDGYYLECTLVSELDGISMLERRNETESVHHSFEMKKTLNNSSKKYEPILDTAEPFG